MNRSLLPDRRDALVQITAAAAALPALAHAQQEHQHHDAPPASKPTTRKIRVATAEQFALLSRVADLIIPRTDTPGAVDAAVPYLIDREMARRGDGFRQELTSGLQELDREARRREGRVFLDLSEERQMALLTAASEQRDTPLRHLFDTMKNLVIELYYSTPQGLKQELGWNANTFLPEFPGCTHGEHQS